MPRSSTFTVEFRSPVSGNVETAMGVFRTIQAARRFAAMMAKTFKDVRVMKGGPGGMPV